MHLSYTQQYAEQDEFEGLLIGNIGYNRQAFLLKDNPTTLINGVVMEGVSQMNDQLFDKTVYLYSAMRGGFQSCDVIHSNLDPEIYSDTISDKSSAEWLTFFDRQD